MADLKARIAKRCAKEFKDGDFANLGTGLPTMVQTIFLMMLQLHCIPKMDLQVSTQLRMKAIWMLISSTPGGTYVTALDRVKFFDTAESFGLVRGGHIAGYSINGAMQVAENGDLANWIVPGKKVAGMGGAMDLVTGAKRVIITMMHTQKGAHKILKKCTLPLTAEKCVDLIITEMGVMEVREDGIWVTELHPDYTKEDIQAATDCELHFDPNMKAMEEE